MSTPVKLGKQGRLVIPAALRDELHLQPGDELLVRAEDGRLVLEPRDKIAERVRGRFADIRQSLADELLNERHEEASHE